MLREAGVTPYGVIEVDGVDTARRLVARGLGVAWLPSTAVVPEFEAERLAVLALAEAPPARRRVVALERSASPEWAPVSTMHRLLAASPSFVPGATSTR
jgi:DNA-binding transcriptional LysR family regulator